ncbi:complement resistance protein TraT [Salidesulfovibrio onnuriiensis]|uniref:complement resistance protein TraT n=1 Tax=Salidesulfovibrio onnuriiensis TaxID=2583823 RepID=UPI0011C8D5A3|nr:complement resistance protein TraT [Salidesulfovibrio onnuriiensis]
MKPGNKVLLSLLCVALLIGGCGKSRYGMVREPRTSLMYGSYLSDNFVVDSSLYHNKKLKVRIRNTSGDPEFDLKQFKTVLEAAYEQAGYTVTQEDDFGILLDVNVKYSGQIQDDFNEKGRDAGAIAGGIAGAYHGIERHDATDTLVGGTIGVVVGATIGTILGSFVTDDTYIIITDLALATVSPKKADDTTTITFGGKKKKWKKNNFRGFRSVDKVRLYVYAGGRMTDQAEISEGVRSRFVRILQDII